MQWRNTSKERRENDHKGLTKIEFDLPGLKSALFLDGSPATPNEIRKRMNGFIDKLLKGRNASEERIVIQ
jgi:hypothetical protein